MAAVLDTSVVVRYLTMDPPDQGAEAQALVDGADELAVPSVALAEAAFALTRLYGIDRGTAVDLLVDLLGRSNLRVLDVPTATAIEALLLCRPSGRVSFADALIWAAARAFGTSVVYTFDRSFPDAGIERRILGRRTS
jgi:predicted nucleic acid-binding protein